MEIHSDWMLKLSQLSRRWSYKMEGGMADKPCERCRMIRFYLVWTILMTVFTWYYLDL